MTTQCPECQKKLETFAVHCEQCGWSLVEAVHGGKKVDPQFEMAFDLAFEQALRHVDRGEFDQARGLVESALHVADSRLQRGEATALRGYLKLKQRDIAGAEADCSQSLELGWHDHRVYAWRAAARGLQNRWPEAVDDLKTAGSRSESEARRYANFELDYLQRSNQWYAEQLKQTPSRADLWLDRGWVRMCCGEKQGAAADFNRALDLDPALHKAALGLALIGLEQREYRSAIELAGRAICSEEVSVQWKALACRARASHLAGRVAEARADVERLVPLIGSNATLRLEQARLRAAIGDLTIALGDLRTLLEQQPELADAWLLKGQIYYRLGNHRAAIQRLEQALRLRPEDALALTGLGQALAALGRTEPALQAFSRARKIDSQLAEAWIGQARMHMAGQAFDLALADIEQAIAIDDQRAESHAVRGQIRLGLCEYSEAVDGFSRAIELSRDRVERAELHYRRGTALHELGDLDRALADFVVSSQLGPDVVGTWVWRAAVHSRLQKWNETVSDLQQVMRFRSDQARSYLTLARPVAQSCVEYFTRRIQRCDGVPPAALFRNRGLAHEFLGNVFQAIEDYRVVMEQERGEPLVTLRLARLLQSLGQHQSAVDYLSRLIRRNRSHHAARHARALSLVALGETERGLSDIVKAIETAPEIARYRLLRAELRLQRGELERARQECDRAIWLDSNDPAGWQLRAAVHRKAGDTEQAIHDLSRAIDLSGESVEFLCRRGEALLRAGRPDAALADFDRCIRRNAALPAAVTGRARALANRGRLHEALLWLTKSMHRFSEPMDLGRILLARGKVFYRMGISASAVSDFSLVVRLVSGDSDAECVARYARALAHLQHGSHDAAARDLKKFLLYQPHHPAAGKLLDWLADRSQPEPPGLQKPQRLVRIGRPKVTRSGPPVDSEDRTWNADPPWDTWVVRGDEDREYGPVPKATLDRWVAQGRIEAGMKVLRGDWSRWKRVEKVYSALQATARQT